jgi:Cys-rich protein (TIGR01571 family)
MSCARYVHTARHISFIIIMHRAYHADTHWNTHTLDNCCSGVCCCALVLPCVVVAENVSLMEEVGIESIPIVSGCAHTTGCSVGTCAGLLYGIAMLGGLGGSNASASAAAPVALSQGIYAVSCLSVYLHSRFRETIRKHYGIPADCCGEHGCSDCCCALCCFPCAMAQERRMLEQDADHSRQTHLSPGHIHSSMSGL